MIRQITKFRYTIGEFHLIVKSLSCINYHSKISMNFKHMYLGFNIVYT